MNATISGLVQPHNQRPAAVWSSGGADYDQISRGIADSIEHCVLRLEPAAGRADSRSRDRHRLDVAARRPPRRPGRRRRHRRAICWRRPRPGRAARAARSTTSIGDAEALPFDDASFDAVVSTVGVMFASRPEAAAAGTGAGHPARAAGSRSRPGCRDSNVFEMFKVMKRYMPPPAAPAPPSPFEWGRTERLPSCWRQFRPAVRGGRLVLPRAERRGGVGHVLDRLRPDAIAGGRLDPRSPRGVAARLRRVPRRLPHRARHHACRATTG